jgi:ribonuclease E
VLGPPVVAVFTDLSENTDQATTVNLVNASESLLPPVPAIEPIAASMVADEVHVHLHARTSDETKADAPAAPLPKQGDLLAQATSHLDTSSIGKLEAAAHAEDVAEHEHQRKDNSDA